MDRARNDAATASPPDGWVTVAKAAAALTDSGDPIDASNVSRYLARFPSIPQERRGKYRFVDLASLKQHRSTNVLVSEKQASRDLAPATVANAVRRVADDVDLEDDDDLRPGVPLTEVQKANLRLKQLKVREAELDIAEREGALIPDHEVLTLVTGVMQTMVEALEREEINIATSLGRDVAAAYRKSRKAAQAAASAQLLKLARKILPDQLAAKVSGEAA